MSEKTKTSLLIVASVLGLILVCYLAVCIACSINGLTFGEQICSMFGQAPKSAEKLAEAVVKTPVA